MPRIDKTCPHCKTVFPCNTWHKKKFCSVECRAAGRARGWKSPKPKGFRNSGNFKPGLVPWNKTPDVFVNCVCGKPVRVPPHLSGRKKFCSKACFYEGRVLRATFQPGERHPLWIDGSSRTGYPSKFNPRLKKRIKERDGNKCQLCGIAEEESQSKIGRTLCVNHIDFNKQNCEESNLNTLCLPCNVRINWDRDKWTRHFQSIASGVAA